MIATSGESTAIAIPLDLTHTVSSAPIATPVPVVVSKPTFAQALRAIAKPTFAQALRGPLPTVEPLPSPSIRGDTLLHYCLLPRVGLL